MTKIKRNLYKDALYSCRLEMAVIDAMTDDLLDIADVLQEHQINIKLDNGKYLNPASAIRSKVEHIWDSAEGMNASFREVINWGDDDKD